MSRMPRKMHVIESSDHFQTKLSVYLTQGWNDCLEAWKSCDEMKELKETVKAVLDEGKANPVLLFNLKNAMEAFA